MVDGPVNPDLGKLLGWINIKLSLIFMRGELSFCFLTNKQNQSEGGGGPTSFLIPCWAASISVISSQCLLVNPPIVLYPCNPYRVGIPGLTEI